MKKRKFIKLKKWFLDEKNREQANLSNANLMNADLRCADLMNANLSNANLMNADLRWTITENIIGKTVIKVQVDTTRVNNAISYWKDLGIWTTGCFQGNLEELKNAVEKTHKENDKLRKRYYKVIDFILELAED